MVKTVPAILPPPRTSRMTENAVRLAAISFTQAPTDYFMACNDRDISGTAGYIVDLDVHIDTHPHD